MASKKSVTKEISYNCPKCGRVTIYSLFNVKELAKGETRTRIYRCNVCGNKISK